MKYDKTDVRYTNDHGNSPEQCSKCKHYVNTTTCAIVIGRIRPEGWCRKFERKSFPAAMRVAFGMALAFLGMSACRASPCMTLHEARQVWPNTYLSWHGEHCWFAKGHREHRRIKRSAPLPRVHQDIPAQDWIYGDRWWLS
jgi:hypothetical protein